MGATGRFGCDGLTVGLLGTPDLIAYPVEIVGGSTDSRAMEMMWAMSSVGVLSLVNTVSC